MNKHLDCLQRAAGGDPEALGHLLAKHRNRLKRMVMFRLDRRLAARIDPSDVVQESLARAVRESISASLFRGLGKLSSRNGDGAKGRVALWAGT